MKAPSGDHDGAASYSGVSVSRTVAPPARSNKYRSQYPFWLEAKARDLPSGLMAGVILSQESEVRRVSGRSCGE